MEKQRIHRHTKSFTRLLSSLLLLFCAGLLYAQQASRSLTLEQIQSLRIRPEDGQNLYTKTDIKFSVTIPNVRPAQVQVLSTDQQSDVTFRTTTVNITDDPATKNPRIVLVFENGARVYSDEGAYPLPLLSVKTGKKLRFTVNLQYATQLVQFSWDIPKDSIFTCTKEFEFTEVRLRERVYTHDLIPVAEFEWTGLIPGLQSLPKFKLNAAGYKGYRSDLFLPDVKVEFLKADSEAEEAEQADIFSAAFFQDNESQQAPDAMNLSKEDCQKLAGLYTKERNAFLNYIQARKHRLDFESQHGIIASQNEIFPSILLYISGIAILSSIAGIIIALKRKHKIRTLIFTVLLLISIFIIVYCIFRRSERYGISAGTRIYSIPQENAEASSEIAGGIRVRILEKTGKWYYVEVGESGGWCSSEDICLIR